MEKIRCFIAIEIPDELKAKIEDYIQELKPIAPKIKWINAKNLHITLKFLGELNQGLLLKVQNELSGISSVVNPFEMYINGAGFFPNHFKPRVVWLGLQNNEDNSINKLHEWMDQKLEALGFKTEKRRFSPHLTLGRIKQVSNYQELNEYINLHKFHSSVFNITRIVLMKSVLRSTGAEYSQLTSYKLKD
jgi:2'-5' RNA ligase